MGLAGLTFLCCVWSPPAACTSNWTQWPPPIPTHPHNGALTDPTLQVWGASQRNEPQGWWRVRSDHKINGKARWEHGVNISAILSPQVGHNKAREEAESNYPGVVHKTRPLQLTLRFKCRLHFMKPSNNKLSNKRVHGRTWAVVVDGNESFLYVTDLLSQQLMRHLIWAYLIKKSHFSPV